MPPGHLVHPLRRVGLDRMWRDGTLAIVRAAGRVRGHRPPPAPARPGELRVLAHIPAYPPATNAGSEQSMRAILTWLVERGHRATVLATHAERALEGTFEGVEVVHDRGWRHALARYTACDVVLTQLEARPRTTRLATFSGRPFVVFTRMGGLSPRTTPGPPDLVVFNASWVQAAHEWPGPSTVVHAPVFPARYRTTRGDAVTLVNLNEIKGGGLLFELAARLPDVAFLGVRGDYGDQLVPTRVPPNVTLVGATPDIREVFSRTRILLMPSRFETFGRLALEAAASGIPTIANPVEGLREAVGDAAIYVARDDVDGWVAAIGALDDPQAYERASARATAVADAWDPTAELVALERHLARLAAQRGGT